MAAGLNIVFQESILRLFLIVLSLGLLQSIAIYSKAEVSKHPQV